MLPFLALVVGLGLLVWSAGRFVDGSAVAARHLGMSPLLIGMVIVGFGTSTPEMLVSALAATDGNPGIALGNAYGSNIANIALILGVTALISPIAVQSSVLRRELPLLSLVTLLVVWQLWDGSITRVEAVVLLAVFAGLMFWTIRQSFKSKNDPLEREFAQTMEAPPAMPLTRALAWVAVGLLLLLASSRLMVWGAVEVAHRLGVSDLIIGLTIVALGTSLPELASSIVAARKNEHEIALGNILGSNLFNTLAVVGIAGVIAPMQVTADVLYRDVSTMTALTLLLFVLGYGFVGQGRINRGEGAFLLACYLGYTGYLLSSAFTG